MSAVGFLYAFFRSLRLKIKNSGQALKQFDFLNDSTRSKMLKSKVTHNADAIITSVATPAEPLQELFGTFLRRKKYERNFTNTQPHPL